MNCHFCGAELTSRNTGTLRVIPSKMTGNTLYPEFKAATCTTCEQQFISLESEIANINGNIRRLEQYRTYCNEVVFDEFRRHTRQSRHPRSA